MMPPPVRVERRVGQRFSYLLPLALHVPVPGIESLGFTQDLSSRGVFFFTDAQLVAGEEIQLTLRMPSEITLGESMPVRCRGRILRVIRPTASTPDVSGNSRAHTKIGVAVRLEGYEYLSEATDIPSSFARVSALHAPHQENQPLARSSARSILG